MNTRTLWSRFLVPRFVVSIVYYVRYRCLISPSSEVDLTMQLEVGRGARVSAFCKIKALRGPVKLGERVSIGAGSWLGSGPAGIEIGDDCLIGPNVSIVGSNYRYQGKDRPFSEQGITSRGVRIGRNVWIGPGCAILDGSTIGDSVIVAPCSVVSQRIPDNAIVQGNPAKIVYVRR